MVPEPTRGQPSAATEQTALAAALGGDPEAFHVLTKGYQRELHVHCYRLLGSFHDAEDALQETLLRAWRHLAGFEGRSSFRGWLYRIATNVCLTHRRRTRPRPAPPPPSLVDAVARSREPALHLSPYPDALLDELEATSGDPVVDYDLRESVQLAFLAALQLLPPRQRAVLILRDVMGFSAAEVAELLDATTASVNSALNRARSSLEQQRAAGRLERGRLAPPDDVARALLQRYLDAWLAVDVGGLVQLLKDEVVLSMPPLPLRYVGRAAAADFFRTLPLAGAERFFAVATRANRQPALAVYRHDAVEPIDHAWGVWVLTLDGPAIAEVTSFVDADLVPLFGLPAEVPRSIG